jgi:predicted phage-related endonuclease
MTTVLSVPQARNDELLGASEVAAVLGLDRYKSPMDIWERKVAARNGTAAPEDSSHEAGFWGHALEPVIRGHYAIQTRTAVAVPKESFVWQGPRDNSGREWLRATPDGVVFETSMSNVAGARVGSTMEWDDGWLNMLEMHRHVGTVGLLQVKTASAYKADEWSDDPPPAYEVQCRVEMAVMDLPWCDLVCLIGGQRYVVHRIHRNVELENNILRDLHAFWQRVTDGTPPDVDESAAWARRAAATMMPTKVTIAADVDARAYMVELKQAKAELERAERQAAELKNQLMLKLGAAGATVIEDDALGKVSAYQVGGRMDYKAYATALENAFRTNLPASVDDVIQRKESYKSKGGTWALRTSWSDE